MFGGIWRLATDKMQAYIHHKERHFAISGGIKTAVYMDECPWCQKSKQWWVDLRAGHVKEQREREKRFVSRRDAYNRHTGGPQ
jgi:hypothetical protein